MIIMQYSLLSICIPKETFQNSLQLSPDWLNRYLNLPKRLDLANFWQWDAFECYRAALLYSFIFYFVFYTAMHCGVVIEYTGLLSQIFDAFVALPQLLKICYSRSVKNLSISMVCAWLLGDLSRLGYYFYKNQPVQFYFGSGISSLIDIIILGQIGYYRISSPSRLENM
jgi:uncharacterized protein with PQ loop repeat